MYGLALEGGGVRGAFHMGAVKALFEEGYRFGGVTGTSIGAINGAIIAQGDFEAGYRLWKDVEAPLLFDIEEEQYKKLIDRRIDRELLHKLAVRMAEIIENKGMDTGKIRKVVESIVDEKKLRSSGKDFGLVTVSITDLKPFELYLEDIPEGKLIDYIMASASFPGFKLSSIGDRYFIDGAFYDNCPINLLARKGYRDIIAVRTLGPGRVRQVKYRNLNIISIIPSEDLGMPLDFNRDLILRNLELGYYDTMRVLKKLCGRKYYISPGSEASAFNVFCTLPDAAVRTLGKLFRIREMPVKRMLFEKIIPELTRQLKLKADEDYRHILACLLEVLAEDYGIDRFRIYTIEEIMDEIEKRRRIHGDSPEEKTGKGFNKKLADALNRKNHLKTAARIVMDWMTGGGSG